IGLSAADAVLESVTVTGNQAADMGGGVYNQTGSPRISNSTIARNEARRGAGLANVEASPVIEDSVFHENVAYTASLLAVEGGGLYSDAGTPELTRVTFSRNEAEDGDGGAIFVEAGAPVLRSATLKANRSGDDGGALFVHETTGGITVSD